MIIDNDPRLVFSQHETSLPLILASVLCRLSDVPIRLADHTKSIITRQLKT